MFERQFRSNNTEIICRHVVKQNHAFHYLHRSSSYHWHYITTGTELAHQLGLLRALSQLLYEGLASAELPFLISCRAGMMILHAKKNKIKIRQLLFTIREYYQTLSAWLCIETVHVTLVSGRNHKAKEGIQGGYILFKSRFFEQNNWIMTINWSLLTQSHGKYSTCWYFCAK